MHSHPARRDATEVITIAAGAYRSCENVAWANIKSCICSVLALPECEDNSQSNYDMGHGEHRYPAPSSWQPIYDTAFPIKGDYCHLTEEAHHVTKDVQLTQSVEF